MAIMQFSPHLRHILILLDIDTADMMVWFGFASKMHLLRADSLRAYFSQFLDSIADLIIYYYSYKKYVPDISI